jgi:cell division protein FtsN
VSKAETAKQKAESDLQTSEKIIILSRTLDENANEIERLIDYLQPSTASVSETPMQALQEETPPVSKNNAPEAKEASPTLGSEATVYMVQVGAFKNKPDKAILKKLGKYEVVSEEDKYKVLVGPFSTKEEASAKRDELVPKGFDGFVVVYEKGKRKK